MSVLKDKKTGKWRVHIVYTYPTGERERVREQSPVQTKRGAEAHERQIRNALQDGTWRKRQEEAAPKPPEPEPKAVPTLAEFEERYFEISESGSKTPSTLEGERSALQAHLIPLFGDRKLDSFTSADGNTLLVRFKGKGESTYNNSATTLNSVLKQAKLDHAIQEIPWRFITKKRKKKNMDFYAPEVFEGMLEAGRRISTTAALAVLVPGEVGCRRSEIFALEFKHCRIRDRAFDIEVSEVIIRRKRTRSDTKGHRIRTVDMSDRVAEALERHIAATGRSTGRIFLRPDGSPFTNKTWRKLMAQIEKAAGFEKPKGKTHIHRHTYCSHLAMLNLPTRMIQAQAGHANISTTEGYMHLSPQARSNARKLLNNRRSLLLDAGPSDGATYGATPPETSAN